MHEPDLWRRRSERVAGAVLAAAMPLVAAGALLHPSEFDPALRSRPGYVPIHLLIASGLVLALPGLLLLLGRLWRRANAFDAAAALLATLGWSLFMAQILYEGVGVPALQEQAGGQTFDVLAGPVTIFYLSGAVAFALGFVLAGIRLPAKGAPVWASRLLCIAPLPILWPPLPDWAGKASVVIFTIGLARLGLWLGPTGPARTGTPRTTAPRRRSPARSGWSTR